MVCRDREEAQKFGEIGEGFVWAESCAETFHWYDDGDKGIWAARTAPMTKVIPVCKVVVIPVAGTENGRVQLVHVRFSGET